MLKMLIVKIYFVYLIFLVVSTLSLDGNCSNISHLNDFGLPTNDLGSFLKDKTRWQVRAVVGKNGGEEVSNILKQELYDDPNFKCDPWGVNLTNHFESTLQPVFEPWQRGLVSCKWNIYGSMPNDIIVISFEKLNIKSTLSPSIICERRVHTKKCCVGNYLKITEGDGTEHFYCNSLNLSSPKVIISKRSPVNVELHASITDKDSPSFYFRFAISSRGISKCSRNQFHCRSGYCIPSRWKCNGLYECDDESDEENKLCKPALYKCGPNSNEVILESQKCDGVIDCSNRSDELGCLDCPKNQFHCFNSKSCFNVTQICNGQADCDDYSDEVNCQGKCPFGQAECGPMPVCYDSAKQRCNGVFDCPNGFDEMNCQEKCPGQIPCLDGKNCFKFAERCNGIVQCSDASDEKNCTSELCSPENDAFLCPNGKCIPSNWSCDHSLDCFDGSDEFRCLKNGVITAFIIGTLICLMLVVVAISCACKLLALRKMEAQRRTMSHYPSNPFHNFEFPMNPGEMDAPFFTSVILREPPPSYHQTMGGYADSSEVNRSYLDYYRRYRRHRRTRRMNRRRNSAQAGLAVPEDTSVVAVFPDPSNSNGNTANAQTMNGMTTRDETEVDSIVNRSNNKKASTSNVAKNNSEDESHVELSAITITPPPAPPSATMIGATEMVSIRTNPIENLAIIGSDNLNIELETMPALPTFDCDSQPLIHH